MADAKFSDWTLGLPASGGIQSTDVLPIVRASGDSREATGAQITTLAQAPWHPGYISGRYYSNAFRVQTPAPATTQNLNTIDYAALQILQPVTITSFGIRTGTGNVASGLSNLGLYSNVGGLPGTLLQTLVTSLAIPATAGTNVTVTPGGGNFTLQPGTYWFAIQIDTTIIFSGDNNTQADMIMFWGTTNTAAWFAASSAVAGYTEARAFASGLPATATPVASTNGLTTAVFKVA